MPTASQALVRAVALDNRGNSEKQNLQICQDTSFLDILVIQLNHTVEINLASSADLPIAAQTADYRQALHRIIGVIFDLSGKRRTGTYKADVSLDDIEKLRKLIKTGLSQKLADPCDARIVLDFKQLARRFILILTSCF